MAASLLLRPGLDIDQMVLFRLLQGMFGAALVPLSQSVMLDIYSAQERASGMSIQDMGVMMGPGSWSALRLSDPDL